MTQLDKIIVHQSFVGLLYENGAFSRTLDPGKHELRQGFFDSTERTVSYVDMRERSLVLKGQEILTSDKVAIRVSILVYYKVFDAVAAVHNVADYESRIYEDVQLAARRFLATRKLEAILNDRNEISDTVREDVKASAANYGVEILRADVKDLVFPGNLREIMNQVLETERRAEAKLIQARKDAEASRIHTDAQAETTRKRQLEQREQARLEAEAARERKQLELQSQLAEAQALRDNPQLLELRKLEALQAMADGGGKFIVGLESELAKLSSHIERGD